MKGSARILAAMLAMMGWQPVLAEDAVLTVTPDKCVALRKGQVCYQKIRLSFKTPEKGDFCIYVEDQDAPLQCFVDASSGEHIHQFASDIRTQFNLIDAESVAVANGQFAIAWVYQKSRKRNRWRLF